MNHTRFFASLLTPGLLTLAVFMSPLALCGRAADTRDNGEFAKKATWAVPTAASARDAALEWLATRELAADPRAQLETMLNSTVTEGNELHLLDVVCAVLAAADPQAQALVAVCTREREQIALPDVTWLADGQTAAFERNNLRLLYGRWLVQQSLFDEAGEQLADLKPEDVVDPAALLFNQAVVQHQTLDRDTGLATITKLMENEQAIPRRYASVARLMQADLTPLKPDSLDHIARRMDDIRRRLDLGRAGPKVRAVEDGVIASLDKLIKKMEDQAAAAAAAAAAGGGRGSMQPNQPAQDSTPMEGQGPGEVARKPVGKESGWGNLPPRQRQEALQQIGKDFPAHYRDVIEQYFRKLASEGEDAEK